MPHHPNDNMQGKLIPWELPEQKHLRHKFGYWRMVETRMIRAQLIEAKEPDDWTLDFKISLQITENHKKDPTLREQQAAERAAAPSRPVLSEVYFTLEELERLAEHFFMANDPISQEIYRKACVGLDALGVKNGNQ